MIVTEYRQTVVCDSCGKKSVAVTIGPPQATVPLDWVQKIPVGITQMKEFCSEKCSAAWKSPIKPWEEDNG